MENTKVNIKMLRPNAQIPVYATASSAGADLHACIDSDVLVAPGGTVMIPTGLAVELPEGSAGLVCARSGLSTKKGLAPANKVGVIDSDYRGELAVALHNHSSADATISPGERIAQLLIVPVIMAEFVDTGTLSDSGRGSGGFGSTGQK